MPIRASLAQIADRDNSSSEAIWLELSPAENQAAFAGLGGMGVRHTHPFGTSAGGSADEKAGLAPFCSCERFHIAETSGLGAGDQFMSIKACSVAIAAAIIIGALPARADPITCDHLNAALVAGASEHQLQTPTVKKELVSSSVAWMISFEGQPLLMLCHDGYVKTFAADSHELNSNEILIMDIALKAWGFEPEEAVKIRDMLITEAKKTHMAEVRARQGRISFIISFAGAPSFVIDANW